MTGARNGNSTSATKRELIALPKWLPPSVEKQVRQIEERSPVLKRSVSKHHADESLRERLKGGHIGVR